MSKRRYTYSLYGLHIVSELELPELFVAEAAAGDVAVVVRRGHVKPLAQDSEQNFIVAGDGITLDIPDVARFAVLEGRDITVDAHASSDPRNVRLFLLGSVFGLLIHQRGLLPLHANAIEHNGAAIAFCGESGAGKSTLAAWFHDRGAKILSDDVCVIGHSSDGTIVAMPGLPRFRLWREALERSGRGTHDNPRSYAGDEAYDKYDVAVHASGAVREPLPLRAIFLLQRGDVFEIERVTGLAAAEILFAHTYRGGYVRQAELAQNHFETCLNLIKDVPIFNVFRRWGYALFDEEADALDRFANSLI